MRYDEFIASANRYYSDNATDFRYGQAVYNHLARVRPDIAGQLLGTPLDPFHRNEVAEAVWEFIAVRW